MRLGFMWIAGALAATLAAGCGGKVVIDASNGQGGAGGGSSTSTFSSTSTGNPQDICQAFCDAFASIGCDTATQSCASDCLSSLQAVAPCEDEFAAVLQCATANVGSSSQCDIPPVCIGALNDFQSCLGVSPSDCTSSDCSGSSDGSCICKGVCGGAELAVECDGGSSKCTCFQNGMVVGECVEPMLTCDFTNGCCSQFFILPGGG